MKKSVSLITLMMTVTDATSSYEILIVLSCFSNTPYPVVILMKHMMNAIYRMISRRRYFFFSRINLKGVTIRLSTRSTRKIKLPTSIEISHVRLSVRPEPMLRLSRRRRSVRR